MKLLNITAPGESTKKVTTILNDESVSKSKKMIALFELGFDVKTVSQLMEVRYNFAYNVISNHINVNGLEVESNKQESKKDKIVELFKQGKTNKEISIELKTNYNYVYNTLKEYKKSLPAE